MHVDSDAAYLVAPKARSRIAGYYYFKNPRIHKDIINVEHPILVECRCLRHVVSSAAEAETAGLFYNGQNIILLRRALHALGHMQKPTPLKTDNATANGFVNNNIHQRRSKPWDMRYYWLRDKQAQNEINIYWKKNNDDKDPNRADYQTKHFYAVYHRGIRQDYVLDKDKLT